MTKQLEQKFKYMKKPVRVFSINDEPWWALTDVCEILRLTTPSKVAERLDDDEKMTLNLTQGHSGKRGGAQSMIVINEAGLYETIIRSDKPEAKAFRRWITHEVLPSIRTQGFYGMPTKQAAMALSRKVGVTLDDYAEYKTGRTLTARIKEVKDEAKEANEWFVYRFSVSDIMEETGASRSDILNTAWMQKFDKKRELAKYVQGQLRFTYQGRLVIEKHLN